MAEKCIDDDNHKPAGRIHSEKPGKKGQHPENPFLSPSPRNEQQGRSEQVAIPPRPSDQQTENLEISVTSSHMNSRPDNRTNQDKDKLEKLLKRIDESNKKLRKENKKLIEKVDEHSSILQELQKDKERVDEHESLLNTMKREDNKRDEKIRIQDRELKKAVIDEKKRAENFQKQFEEVSEEISRNKKICGEMHTEVEQMSKDSKILAEQINDRFDEVQANQKSSESRLIEKLDALEARQKEYFSKIDSKQQEMYDMIRIIKAMRIESDNGPYFAKLATEENENEDIPEDLQSEAKETLDVRILGHQTDKITRNKHETITSKSNQIVTKRQRPFHVPGNLGIPPL